MVMSSPALTKAIQLSMQTAGCSAMQYFSALTLLVKYQRNKEAPFICFVIFFSEILTIIGSVREKTRGFVKEHFDKQLITKISEGNSNDVLKPLNPSFLNLIVE